MQIFHVFIVFQFPKETKKTKPNIEIRPESVGVIILAELHAGEAEHHGLKNLVIYPSEKFW